MSLVLQIQNDAINDAVRAASLLRKCLLLASRIDGVELEDWVRHELDGYAPDVAVPAYRVWPLRLHGDFVGPFGARCMDLHIPPAALPPNVAAKFKEHVCRESIASIEAILATGGKAFQVDGGNLAIALQGKVVPDMNCMAVRAVFGANQLASVVDAVRNRILDFACQIAKLNLPVDEIGAAVTREQSSQVTQIYYTTINGQGATFIGGELHADQLGKLKDELSEKGLEQDQVTALCNAIESDPKPTSGRLGPRVRKWLFENGGKLANGVGTKLITEIILKYFA